MEELERKIALFKKEDLTFGDLPRGISSETFLEKAKEICDILDKMSSSKKKKVVKK